MTSVFRNFSFDIVGALRAGGEGGVEQLRSLTVSYGCDGGGGNSLSDSTLPCGRADCQQCIELRALITVVLCILGDGCGCDSDCEEND